MYAKVTIWQWQIECMTKWQWHLKIYGWTCIFMITICYFTALFTLALLFQEGLMIQKLEMNVITGLTGCSFCKPENSCFNISMILNSSHRTFSLLTSPFLLFIIIPSFLKALYNEEDPRGCAEWRLVWMSKQLDKLQGEKKDFIDMVCARNEPFKAVGKANVMQAECFKVKSRYALHTAICHMGSRAECDAFVILLANMLQIIFCTEGSHAVKWEKKSVIMYLSTWRFKSEWFSSEEQQRYQDECLSWSFPFNKIMKQKSGAIKVHSNGLKCLLFRIIKRNKLQ